MNNHRTLVYLLTSLNIAHSLTAKQLYKKLETSLFPKSSSSSSTSSFSHINHNRSLQNNHKCLDVKDWYDSDGTYYDCQWYGEYDSRCSNHGHSYENFGYVANEACCACGGGVQHSYPDIFKDGDTSACGKIQVKATGKFLHLDGNGDKLLSTRYQPNDDYTKFILEKQDDDASYRIKVKADSSYLHENGATNGDKLLSTRYQPNDDYTKFFLEYQQDDASYKIRVKANGRYWHEDGGTTELVSTLWQPDDDFVRFNLLPCETTTTIPIQDYKVIEDGTCKSNGMLPIYDKETCIDAASALGYSIEWGPHGGYQDVVDGCSIRFGAHLFLNSQEGTCDPEHGIGGWTHTGCQCADWMPCFCEEISYQHIPNTYCEYYEQGGDGDCSDGLSFVDVWEKCLEDGSDKCMGVMWNSCEGPTSDINVNGAWKLMKAGQDVGDANNPTATCGGKRQALGHWDVFLV